MWVISGGWQGSKRPLPELVQNQISYDLNLSSFPIILSAKRCLSLWSLFSIWFSHSRVLISRHQAPQVFGLKLAVSSVTSLPGFPHATVSAPCCLARSGWCGRVSSAIAAHRRSIEMSLRVWMADENEDPLLSDVEEVGGSFRRSWFLRRKSGEKGGRTPNVGRCQVEGLSLSFRSPSLGQALG